MRTRRIFPFLGTLTLQNPLRINCTADCGKALVTGAKPLQMLILVLLAARAKDYDFLKQIKSADSRPRFGVILREMPVESETAFAEGVAKEILNTIRSSR
jgi:hypothetical protein